MHMKYSLITNDMWLFWNEIPDNKMAVQITTYWHVKNTKVIDNIKNIIYLKIYHNMLK